MKEPGKITMTKLELLRKSKGLTQTELAKRAGISSVFISLYETGAASKPSRRFRQKIAAVLDVEEEILFE